MSIEDFFNRAPIKVMATVSENGEANLCPCGTAMIQEGKIVIGCIGIARSRENIRRMKKVTFMVQRPISKGDWRRYERVGKLPNPAGYRLYCTLVEETQKKEVLNVIRDRINERVGERVASKLASVMIFNIDEKRAISF